MKGLKTSDLTKRQQPKDLAMFYAVPGNHSSLLEEDLGGEVGIFTSLEGQNLNSDNL